MKFRFSTVNKCQGFGQKQEKEITFFAFDTQEVVAWTLYYLGDDSTNLDLWLKGVAEPLHINEEILGAPNFQAVLTLLASEFPEIDNLKFSTVS